MNGVHLTRVLRDPARSPNPGILVALTTSSVEPKLLREACEAGIESFIRKPITPAVLVKRLAAMIANPVRFVAAEQYYGPTRRRHKESGYGGIERRVAAAPAGGEGPATGAEAAPSGFFAGGVDPRREAPRQEPMVQREWIDEADEHHDVKPTTEKEWQFGQTPSDVDRPQTREWDKKQADTPAETPPAQEWEDSQRRAQSQADHSAVEWEIADNDEESFDSTR